MEIRDLVLVGGVRTPMGEFNGSLAGESAIDLGVHAAKALFARSGVAPEDVDHTIVGNVIQTSRDAIYCARHVALRAGVPKERPAVTVNRLCGSGIEAIVQGAHRILLGEATVCLVGGAESMSQAPHCLWGARQGFRFAHAKLEDYLLASLMDPYSGCYMADTSNNLAKDYGISRQEQDELALESQRRAHAAWEEGRLGEEVVPIEVGQGKRAKTVERDEHIRPDSSLEGLAKLPPAFDPEGSVTAGNASGIVDGAAMLILTSEEKAKAEGWEVLGRLLGWNVVGVEPSRMGIGPAPAIRGVLERLGMAAADLDLVEINEAFAGQLLAVVRELDLDTERLNVNGGAIALGHPLGATGARLTNTLLRELGRRGGGRGVASACIGGGQGIALAVEAA